MSLIHYWRLNEESGSAVTDSVGSLDGEVLNDGASVVDGLFGKARDLSQGTDDGESHIVFPSGPGTVISQWTLTCWVKFTAQSKRFPRFWYFAEVQWDKNQAYFYTDTTIDQLGFGLYDSAGNDYFPFSALDIGQTFDTWHLLVLRATTTTVELLLDNVVVITAAISAPVELHLDGQIVAFGGEGMAEPTDSQASQIADELALFDHALSAQEITAIWNGGTGAPISALYGLQLDPPPDTSWADAITTEQKYYTLEIDDGVLDPIRIPISSWQATVQTGRASYAAAVIPGALQWVDAVNDRADAGRFTVYRGVRYQNGETQETEMASAPLQVVQFDQGPTNATMSISGYETVTAPGYALTRTLTNVRSRSISAAGLRVRCDVDFFLRPGHTAVAQGDELQVAYINYYANSSDEYMDVGERLN